MSVFSGHPNSLTNIIPPTYKFEQKEGGLALVSPVGNKILGWVLKTTNNKYVVESSLGDIESGKYNTIEEAKAALIKFCYLPIECVDLDPEIQNIISKHFWELN